MTTNWSTSAWAAISDVYERTIEHPFVRGIADGTLPRERFDFYIRQDSLYLRSYFKVLSHIASRIESAEYADDFIRFAANGLAVEQALHQSLLAGAESNRPAEMSPTCALYTSTLLSQALEPVEVEVAAVLPCFWVYRMVGEHILKSAGDLVGNPYSQWIQTYGDAAFAESTRRAIMIADDMAANAAESIRLKMTEIFRKCARLEWMFWDSAWNLEKWKI